MNTLTWKEARKHGIEGTDLNFEFKMASLDNVVFIDCRIMDVAFLISLTHKKFSSHLQDQVSSRMKHTVLYVRLRSTR